MAEGQKADFFTKLAPHETLYLLQPLHNKTRKTGMTKALRLLTSSKQNFHPPPHAFWADLLATRSRAAVASGRPIRPFLDSCGLKEMLEGAICTSLWPAVLG